MYSTGDDHELYQRKGAWPTSQLLNDLRRCQEVDSPVTRERSHGLQPGSNWVDHQLLLATWTSIALLYGETLRKGGIPLSSAPNHPYYRNWATSKTQAATQLAALEKIAPTTIRSWSSTMVFLSLCLEQIASPNSSPHPGIFPHCKRS